MSNEDLLALARRIFAAQPFSTYLGAELLAAGAGSAEIALPLRPELTQQHGFAHGGVVSYLADNALTFAGGLALGGDALTSEYKLNYLRPAQGASLLARAEALSVGKRQAVCRCVVLARDDRGVETLCAAAQGTVIRTAP
ncbi:MAG: PaaI family thioesterase [Allgaiera sp.]|jgi:uncharacterized protein (TIGR00369 family)|nr:PaaI family thioesterase [Allgaiera sp.]